MSGWQNDPEDQPQRDVFAARLTPVAGPGDINPVSELLANELRNALHGLDEKRTTEGKAPLPGALTSVVPTLAATALGAVEGTLRGKGLDGALKEAEILKLYAEAREMNANAVKAEIEAQQLRIVVARERLALVIDMLRVLGVDPSVAVSQGGLLSILVGEGLAEQLLTSSEAPRSAKSAEDG